MIDGAVNVDAIVAPKLASVVARRIEDEVAALGWPVGEVLGSEAELLARYGVSRAVLREAVRILEHTGAARMRRGPGGGLVVSAPDRAAVVTAMGVWFSFVGVTTVELLEVRRFLLEGAVHHAAQRRTDAALEAVRADIDDVAGLDAFGAPELVELDGSIAAMAANPALSLFVEAIGDIGVSRLRNGRTRFDPPATDAELRGHLQRYRTTFGHIEARDPMGAAAAMAELSDAVDGRLVDGRRSRRSSAFADGDEKLAERIASAVRDDIEAAGWPVGHVLGSEMDLVERHGVSRTILREAVRILEHHGAVTTKRGPHGGLIVSRPDHSATVRSARLVLEHEGVTSAQLSEARSMLEVAAARLAAIRADEEAAAQLSALLDIEGRSAAAAEHFMPIHHAIAAATGNRLLTLFVDVMGELIPSKVPPDRRTPDGLAALSLEVHHAHGGVVAAIIGGDPDLAERRMARHVEASADVLV